VSNVARANNDEVVTEVVQRTISLKIINGKVSKYVCIASCWLSHHVVAICIIVAVLERGPFEVSAVYLVVGGNLLSAKLELGGIEVGPTE